MKLQQAGNKKDFLQTLHKPQHHCSRTSTCDRCCTRIEHLSVSLGNTKVLDDVNLHIHCGELTAIVGRNGAGKTTFLRAMLNEIPHQGQIHFKSTTEPCTDRPQFGYVPQKLFVEKGSPVSVGDLVLSCLSRWPVWLPRRPKDRTLIRQVLERTQTEHLSERRVSDLSGGELQRVMLALAITPVPNILLLDEPVSGVDRKGLVSFYNLVSSLRKQHDLTILLISHDLDLIARHADRVVFIDQATAVAGSPADIFNRSDFIAAFGKIVLDSNSKGDASS